MNSRLYFLLGFMSLGAGLVGVVSLHRHNAQRRVQVAALKRARGYAANQRPISLERPDQEPPTTLPLPSTATDPGAAKLLAVTRAEIAALEQSAARQHSLKKDEITDAPSTNRDPEKAMTRLEYFQNVGQATPAAAMQTLFWAALNGNEAVMAQTIGFDPKTQSRMEEIIASLPEAQREKYGTPEALAALFISKYSLDVSALQFIATEIKDEGNASLTVRGLLGIDQRLPMHLGPQGWQLLEGVQQVDWLRGELLGKK
jgi:hypothetical protein